jgi:hypothetical protein
MSLAFTLAAPLEIISIFASASFLLIFSQSIWRLRAHIGGLVLRQFGPLAAHC